MKNTFLYLILSCTILYSCSAEKRISKFVKKKGPKEVIAVIAIEYPEYLKTDSVTIEKVKEVPVEVKVPEYIHDTVYKSKSDTINLCQFFTYSDNRLSMTITTKKGKTRVSYKINEVIIRDTVSVYIKETAACPPCPTVDVINSLQKRHIEAITKEETRKSFYRNSLIILLILVALYVIGKVKNFIPF